MTYFIHLMAIPIPMYSGAIGMTFEQGGGGRGGLSVVTNAAGDTLTLVDRVNHHYTTGLSTIEVASQNAQRLITEYKKFFDDSRAGKGNAYKTYILTSDNAANNQQHCSSFASKRNRIWYSGKQWI
ncbi:MAG: hypothetical protein WKG06_02415 [Segetibacter sp.]